MSTDDPVYADILAAATRIAPYVHVTPLLAAPALSARLGVELSLKCENLQETGAFKARGACNAVFALAAAVAARGVVTHSSGNHAAALARAARLRALPAYIVMPRGVARVKRAAVAAYGATIVDCEPTLVAREAAAAALVAASGATLVHPYDEPLVIAGQGTLALELAAATAAPDAVLVPVGGGGLLSGVALACRTLWPQVRVVGVEPLGADDAQRSLRSGVLQAQPDPRTIADGLRGALSARTLRLITAHASDIVTVGEDSIVAAMRLVHELHGLVVEPSAAVPLAALLEGKVAGRRMVVVLSGGNVDPETLPWHDAAAVAATVARRGA